MTPDTLARPYTLVEAAAVLGWSHSTTHRRIADGTLRVTRVGRLVRVQRAEIERLLAPTTAPAR